MSDEPEMAGGQMILDRASAAARQCLDELICVRYLKADENEEGNTGKAGVTLGEPERQDIGKREAWQSGG